MHEAIARLTQKKQEARMAAADCQPAEESSSEEEEVLLERVAWEDLGSPSSPSRAWLRLWQRKTFVKAP